MRLWYLICVILFIESISILIDERYDVTYHLEYDPNWQESIEYSSCVKLNRILKHSIELKLNNLVGIYKYFEGKYNSIQNKNLRIFFLNKIELREFFIYQELFCIIMSKEEYEIANDIGNRFVFNKDNGELFILKRPSLLFNKIIIDNLESPYSNCKYKNINRFTCLNDCYKNNNKLSKYYYHSEENVTIKLNYNRNDNQIKINETNCLKECKKQGDDCKLILFKEKYDRSDRSNSTIFQAYPSISEFDYWIQFVGLICFFTNLCLYYLLDKLIKSIGNKLKISTIKIKKYKIKINLKKCLNYFKFFILFIWFLILCFLIYQMINKYLDERDQPIKKEITTTELQLKSINLAICIPLKLIDNYNNEIKNLSELENKISHFNLFNDQVESIYLEYQSKKIKINYKLNETKILFKNKRRCYQIEISPNEYKYQSQLLVTKLIIEFNHKNKEAEYNVYLLTDDKILYFYGYNIDSNYLFVKKEIKRSKSNKINKCKDNEVSKSESDIFYNCIRSEYIVKNQSIPFKLIIDKDQFTPDEWTKLSINYTSNINKNFHECLNNNFIQIKCFETKYENYLRNDNIKDYKLRIELYYDIIKEIEEEPSIYKLMMNILNIQSIQFGLNFFNFITILFNYNKIKFKYNKLLIYLLCLIGFGYHLWFIFNEIINGELIYSQHYKLEEKLKVPNFIFCIKYDQNLINLNHKLTYKYLDRKTNRININELINKIKYLNKSNNWNRLNNSNIDTFYFLDKKCFEIKFNFEYELDQFEFNDDNANIVIKAFFNRIFFDKNEIFYLTRISETMQFSKLNKLDLNNDISIELFEIDYDDKFSLIKNPLSLIYGQNDLNNADKYLNNLINNFKNNYNLVTLNLPLNNSDDLEIEDQLFDQLYLQIQNSTDYNQPNQNFKRIFITINKESDLFLKVNLIFFKKIIKITNEDNYTKLIVNLLNLLSLWFDLGLFDVHIYLDLIIIKIKFIFIFLYKLLIKIKCKLFLKMNLVKDAQPLNHRPRLKVPNFLKSYT